MPTRFRAALKGLLQRSISSSSVSTTTTRAEKHEHEPDNSSSSSTTGRKPCDEASDLHATATATPSRSRTKLSITKSKGEEEEDDEQDDSALVTAENEDVDPPVGSNPIPTPAGVNLDDDDHYDHDKHEDDDTHRNSTWTWTLRHGSAVSADKPTLLIQSATIDSDKPDSDKPDSDKPDSDRPTSDKLTSDKPTSDRPTSDKPTSDKDSGRLRLPDRPQSRSLSRPSSPLRQETFPSDSHPPSSLSAPQQRPTQTTLRRQSLITGANTPLVRALLGSTTPAGPPLQPETPLGVREASDYLAAAPGPAISNMAAMMTRKIWIKRPGASPTMVTVREDDLVDDVRDLVMRKYSNSLGRSYDSPDIVLRIVSRPDNNNQRATERLLAPDEDICRTLDLYYSGGQTVDEALLIETPARRTPRPSPHAYYQNSYAALDEYRPAETGTDYFPPMPAVNLPAAPPPPPNNQTLHPEQPRSIAVLNTGQIPLLPSPGSAARRPPRDLRPKFNRQHTSSPTIMTHNAPPPPMPLNASNLSVAQHLPPIRQARPRVGSSASEQPHPILPPTAPTMATPPISEAPTASQPVGTPPTPATSTSNTLRPARPARQRKLTPTDGTATNTTVKSTTNGAKSSLPSSLLDGSVPPINVLIVEDNMINMKLLEAFMKRLKVRWSTAMNGQIAVNKWRAGGFHLVLMDIQLPIMSGLEATKEIRRLERVNGIGVFSNASANGFSAKDGDDAATEEENKKKEDDKLELDGGSFKSPVIIVALTASSLQSDRHEALAAGCNDFLTKPVNFVWLERKVKEWGCMQALIDFDGWRKWKELANANQQDTKSAADKLKEKKAKRISRASLEPAPPRSPRPGASPEPPAANIEGVATGVPVGGEDTTA